MARRQPRRVGIRRFLQLSVGAKRTHLNEVYVLMDKDGIYRIYSSRSRIKSEYEVKENLISNFLKSGKITRTILYNLFNKYCNEKLRYRIGVEQKAKIRRVFYAFLDFLSDKFGRGYKLNIADLNSAISSFFDDCYFFYVEEKLPKAKYDLEEVVEDHIKCAKRFFFKFLQYILQLFNEKQDSGNSVKDKVEKEELLNDSINKKEGKVGTLSCRIQGNKELLKKIEKEISSRGFVSTYRDDSNGVTGRLYFNIGFDQFLTLIGSEVENLDKKKVIFDSSKQQNMLNKEKENVCCNWTEEEIVTFAKKYDDDSDLELFRDSETTQRFFYSSLLRIFLREIKKLNLPKDNYLLLGKIGSILEILEKHDLIGELGYERKYYNYRKREWRLQHVASLGEAFLEIAIRYLKKDAIGLLDEYVRKFISEPQKYLKPLSYKKYEFDLEYRLEKYQKILESINNCFDVIIENYPVDRHDLKKLK